MKNFRYLLFIISVLFAMPSRAWQGMDMPELHIDGRWLVDENGNKVNLHGFGQTYSPWFNEMGTKWSNYDVDACLKYNKGIIDGIMKAGWKMTYIRMHMDPYWSNTPGMHVEGENDISAFDFNRFRTYLNQVFIPMAEYAISKGLYVVMRPPGVCPHRIAVGDDYHKYLKRVWGYVSTQKKLTENPHIMFELANEPVDILGTDGVYSGSSDGAHQALTQFFQEIVDLMRSNGCNNILWVPGTGYQSQYAGFAKYPVKGDNIGYAVHVYPGWYGSDAIEPSHELGGSYGGGFDSFAAGWANQIEPCAKIAPMLVTEMDWAPSVYEASWGKSITGKMLGSGFGANFKYLADKTGNVGWMIFTGPELIKNFNGVKGENGKYTLYNDPDACLWPVYHWYMEYAGFELPEIQSVDLAFSPREKSIEDKFIMLTGSRTGAALIADRGIGVDFNISGDIDVEIGNPEIVSWENGYFCANGIGETDCVISYSADGKSESKEISILSTPFPLKNGYFNPSIWENGYFDEQSGIIRTGQYGFAGWKYQSSLDLSGYKYLIVEAESEKNCGLSFRLFDIDNYWTDPAIFDFGNSKRLVIDLSNLKSNDGRKLDPSHIFIAGFWTTGNVNFKVNNIFPSDNRDAESGVEDVVVDSEYDIVDVMNLQGIIVKRGVERKYAEEGLDPGIYIIGKKKVLVR